MKQMFLAVAAATLVTAGAGVLASASGQSEVAAPVYGVKIPAGYRDWRVISAAGVGAIVNDVRVKLGNDVAIKAYRNATIPFPDGTIIARLAYRRTTSEENNTAFRAAALARGAPPDVTAKLLAESFVAGAPVDVQFMVKDSKRYAATGGWGFAQFTDGKPDGEAVHKSCFACHAPARAHDYVFTRYAP